MKTKIHPEWHEEAVVVCACGSTFTIGSTKPEIRIEICSKCHPFFTGESRLADTEGKVDLFNKKVAAAKKRAPELAKKRAKKSGQVTDDAEPKSLKEMLMGAQ